MGEEMPNSEISGFGGRPLKTLMAAAAAAFDVGAAPAVAVQPESVERLRGLGIEDCEQLVGAVAVPEISGKLRTTLDLSDEDFESLLFFAREQLPEGRAELLARPAPADVGRGARKPSPDVRAVARRMARAAAVSAEEADALPESKNLIEFMSPIRAQGGRPTCAAFALTALNEYVRRHGSLDVDLSEQHLYYQAKLTDGDPHGCGTFLATAVTILRDLGQCRESIWPYDPTLPCKDQGTPPSTAASDGLDYQLHMVAVEENSVPAYKTQLARSWPVAVAIPTYDSWFRNEEVRRSGRITMRIGDEAQAEGHALVIVGYQNNNDSPGGGYFIVRNSWAGWAYGSLYGAGYGTIPYQYITNDAWEAYAITLDPSIPDDEAAETIVRIKVGSNVEITIEDVIPDDDIGRVSRVSRVSRGRGPRPMRVSRADE
jgi:C1A family cysteine protease